MKSFDSEHVRNIDLDVIIKGAITQLNWMLLGANNSVKLVEAIEIHEYWLLIRGNSCYASVIPSVSLSQTTAGVGFTNNRVPN